MMKTRFFFFFSIALLWLVSYSNAESINIDGNQYTINEVECSATKVSNNNNWKYKLSISFSKNWDEKMKVTVYDNTVSGLFEEWAILWLNYHEVCSDVFPGTYCVQVSNSKLRIKWNDISVWANKFNWKGYIQFRSEINNNGVYIPTQKIYFDCKWNKPYSAWNSNYNEDDDDNYNNWWNYINNSYNTYNYYTTNNYITNNYYNNSNNNSNENCALEWQISNSSLWPNNYKPCCNWLSTFNHTTPGLIWAWVMCYDPNKGTPVCRKIWTSKEWRYYSNWTLLRYWDCNKNNIYNLSENVPANNKIDAPEPNDNSDCTKIGQTYNKICCQWSMLVSSARGRFCVRTRNIK